MIAGRICTWMLGAWVVTASGVTDGSHPDAARVQGAEDAVQGRYGCVVCHADKRRAFRLGIHSERGIRCHDCHGGDPGEFEREAAHRGGYIGSPEKIATARLCASCHSDPNRMRQYGLPADQLAEFRTSRHGELLLGRHNADAPTCTDCHDAHTILSTSDARSTVYPTRIPSTCGRCHQDSALMAKYGLATDQIARHRESAHGTALFEQQNFAAPTCVSCHGSHAALPPDVVEIANVCGRCHVLVRRAFYSGPHGDATLSGALPGCTACHSNHGTERVSPDRIAATCTRCHERDSPAARAGLEIEQRVTRATLDIEGAEEAIAELVRHGRRVTDLRFRYRTAATFYKQIAEAQHSLDVEALDELTRRVSSISGDIRTTAEVSAEQRWEHKLILVPVWFLALAATVLAWFKLRSLSGGPHRQ